MLPEVRILLIRMREAAEAISAFVQGKTVEQLATDPLFRSGVYFQFIMIGEALGDVKAKEPSVAERISEHWRIIGFRNQIVHAYEKIDDQITWRIITQKLPILLAELEELLKQ